MKQRSSRAPLADEELAAELALEMVEDEPEEDVILPMRRTKAVQQQEPEEVDDTDEVLMAVAMDLKDLQRTRTPARARATPKPTPAAPVQEDPIEEPVEDPIVEVAVLEALNDL